MEIIFAMSIRFCLPHHKMVGYYCRRNAEIYVLPLYDEKRTVGKGKACVLFPQKCASPAI